METATVIEEGGWQTVRLPKGFHISTPTVSVRHEGRSIVLEPLQPRAQLADRFDVLQSLTDGWHDGKGIAPVKTRLTAIAENFARLYPEHLPVPAIAPTPEGNLVFEWDVPDQPSVDLDLSSLQADFHAFRSHEQDIEREFYLTSNDAWHQFFTFLNEALERRPE